MPTYKVFLSDKDMNYTALEIVRTCASPEDAIRYALERRIKHLIYNREVFYMRRTHEVFGNVRFEFNKPTLPISIVVKAEVRELEGVNYDKVVYPPKNLHIQFHILPEITELE